MAKKRFGFNCWNESIIFVLSLLEQISMAAGARQAQSPPQQPKTERLCFKQGSQIIQAGSRLLMKQIQPTEQLLKHLPELILMNNAASYLQILHERIGSSSIS
jgi:hypothetical protein